MTPSEINTLARQKYNAVGDTFFADTEIYSYLWQGCMELALKSKCIQRVYTTSTVASQQEYSYPTSTLEIKRITYEGTPLDPITFAEDDQLTGYDADTTSSGTPRFYGIWNETLYLRPIPSAVGTLKIFSFNEPQEITNTSTLEVPSRYHLDLTDYVVLRMFMKDQNREMIGTYGPLWNDPREGAVAKAVKHEARRKRGNRVARVQDEERLAVTEIGAL